MNPRLKALELHGYKTFASKINFEFPGSITAIVAQMVLENPIFRMRFVGYWESRVTVCCAAEKQRI